MPNWCNCDLTVSGPRDEVARFVAEHHTTGREMWDGLVSEVVVHLDFLVDTPYPENRDKSQEDGWYDFALQNWSVKWIPDCDGASYTILENGKAGAYYTFDSPWREPKQWLYHASRRYPSLEFTMTYIEYGMGFCGVIRLVDGAYKIDRYINDFTIEFELDCEDPDCFEEIPEKFNDWVCDILN